MISSKEALFLAYLEENQKLNKASRASSVEKSKQVMVVGMDDSDYSVYALEWTLNHFFIPFASNPVFTIVIVHAKPSSPAMALAGSGFEVLPTREAELKKMAIRVEDKVKEICASKSVNDMVIEMVARDARNVLCEAIERHKASIFPHAGQLSVKPINHIVVNDVVIVVVARDARNVLCEAVERHKASMLVSGSHGYGAIKRAVLGSVSDYCSHHARCTVMIVKRPKIKN